MKIISLRLNPKHDWDRVILKWLERIPSGERSAMIKYFLWQLITGESLEGGKKASFFGEVEQKKDEASERLSRKFDSLKFECQK